VLVSTHILYQQTLSSVAERMLFAAHLVLTREDFRLARRRLRGWSWKVHQQ
jgi:hypothetical protein